MPSTYSTSLRIELQADGENSSTWGSKANNDFNLFEQAIAGVLSKSVAGAADVTLTASNGASDESRNAVHRYTGVLTGNIGVIMPAAVRNWMVSNETTGSFSLTAKGASGTGTIVPQGSKRIVYFDGTNTVPGAPYGDGNTSDLKDVPSLKQVQNSGFHWGGTAGGTAAVMTATLTPAPTAYVAGQVVRLLASATAVGGGTTVNFNGLGAKTIKKGIGTLDIAAGDWQAGQLLELVYDGTNFQMTSTAAPISNLIGSAHTFTAVQQYTAGTLTDAASISWDASTAPLAKVTLGGNRTLANPTNVVADQFMQLRVIQDGTGSRTLAYGTNFDWGSAGVPTLTTTAGKYDIIQCYAVSSTKILAWIAKGFGP